jgi:hypothetical protein
MRVGAWESCVNHSVKVVLLANGNKYEVYSNTFFLGGKALSSFEPLPFPNPDLFFDTNLYR